jgi:hypothetical protein
VGIWLEGQTKIIASGADVAQANSRPYHSQRNWL